MRVLIACEYSGAVREAFKARGHYAMSCDLLDTDVAGNHYVGDVFDIINDGWDLMVAHPPCTYLTNSGVCWLYNKDGSRNEPRGENLKEGAEFFAKLLNAPIPKIAVENPIMHKHGKALIGNVQPTQIIQPFMFGHPERKATCLWLKNLPALKETNNVKQEMEALPKSQQQRIHYLSPSKDRWKERSRTFRGIAEAMADQWNF